MIEQSLNSLLIVSDIWQNLSLTNKPVVLYGMGDGGDKILNVCEEKNIEVSGVFASDGFVRGQHFRGYTVKKYSDLKNELDEMIILVAFASSLPDVMENIYKLTQYDEVFAPDVPVFGSGLFDSTFFKENFENFNKVYNMLSDDISRRAYYNILKYKLTGDIKLLKECETSVSEAYASIIQPASNSSYVDIGAYTGDTLKEYVAYSGNNITAFAFEPDAKNFKKLENTAKDLDLSNIKLYNIAAWNKSEELIFYSRSGRNSAHTSAHSGAKARTVTADCVDNYIKENVDFVNIDAEGSDIEALEGMKEIISAYHPTISCAVYHRNEDMFKIPLYLAEKYAKFNMYLRHFPYIPAWDTNIYIKPVNEE